MEVPDAVRTIDEAFSIAQTLVENGRIVGLTVQSEFEFEQLGKGRCFDATYLADFENPLDAINRIKISARCLHGHNTHFALHQWSCEGFGGSVLSIVYSTK